MILILSRSDDGSTTLVTQWLKHFKKPYIRLNGDKENSTLLRYDSAAHELYFYHNDRKIDLLQIRSLWYRRRGFSMNNLIRNRADSEVMVFLDNTGYQKLQLTAEAKDLLEYFIYSCEKNCERIIGRYFFSEVNKFVVMSKAKEKGFLIPSYIIASDKRDILDFRHKLGGKAIITKAISNGIYFNTDRYAYYSYTEEVDDSFMNELPDTFFPSLFQEKIDKKYELRVFYLHGELYSMAIFSQRSDDTAVDFRKKRKETPNRQVPYILPEDVRQRLRSLFNELSLDTGSADIIVDIDNNYFFLEINPVGQFGMTSVPCNYYLERKIAEYL